MQDHTHKNHALLPPPPPHTHTQGEVDKVISLYKDLQRWDEAIAVAQARVSGVLCAEVMTLSGRGCGTCVGPPGPSRSPGSILQVADGHQPGGEGRGAEGEARGPYGGGQPLHEGGACL